MVERIEAVIKQYNDGLITRTDCEYEIILLAEIILLVVKALNERKAMSMHTTPSGGTLPSIMLNSSVCGD